MSDTLQSQITQNIKAIRRDISDMCEHVGVPKCSPNLIAVSKVQPKDRVVAALEAGHRVFGENRLQEAEERWDELKPDYDDLELHLIGGLQTNKVGKAVALFDVIQTVDRIKLAKKLAGEMASQDRQLPVYLQVNTGKEDQKGGCLPQELPALVAASKEAGLNVVGLMCIPPKGEDPTLHFGLLKKLAKRHGLEKLSMGMSGDFALAAVMGATDIRVGTAIFGERDYG
jgi:pyridoxal phosphate enzyme (YggS family)